MTDRHRSCDKVTKSIIYCGGVFHLNNLSKHEQKNHIYHCCMLYLTDPGAPGTFQTWRPQKSLISPSSGELSPLQYGTLPGVIRCGCSVQKLLIAVCDNFRYNTRKQSLFFSFSFSLIPRNLCVRGCFTEKNARQDVWKRVAERNARPRHSVPSSFPKP